MPREAHQDDKMALNLSITDTESASGSLSSYSVTSITNGICRFNPVSKKGKWIFLAQTVFLSFTPILILLIQNGFLFNDMLIRKDIVLARDRQIVEVSGLSAFVFHLQRERSAVAFSLFLSLKSGLKQDLSSYFAETDKSLSMIQWRQFGDEKIFYSKLRFQIKLDDFRQFVDKSVSNNSDLDANDEDVLNFYTLASTKILTSLEQDMASAQSGNNWRLIMIYFNVIKMIESTGIGLVYGLRFYMNGELNVPEMIQYIQHNALVEEYFRQTKELLLKGDILDLLETLFAGEGYRIVTSSAHQILGNVMIESNHQKGRIYFEGTTKFTSSLTQVLSLVMVRIRELGVEDLYSSLLSQVWGICLLIFVLLASPLLMTLAKNAIMTIQLFAWSVENKAVAMRRQQHKQRRLIFKMLPKVVVERMTSGQLVAETFESATLFFSTVVGFKLIARKCTAMETVHFLNELYTVMDKRMDEFEVYKVETISDSYLVASGLPKKNGDKHASEICKMAINLFAACGLIVRPDKRPQTIQLQAGIHTGAIVAGVVGTKMPRYCLFGDTINTASRMQSQSEPGMIQVSQETKMLLDMEGGFLFTERGSIEIKGKGFLQTFWLDSIDYSKRAKTK